MSELLTIGAVAREINQPRPRVAYAVDKVGIRERARAGILRLFGRDQIPSIEAAVNSIRPLRRAEAPERLQR